MKKHHVNNICNALGIAECDTAHEDTAAEYKATEDAFFAYIEKNKKIIKAIKKLDKKICADFLAIPNATHVALNELRELLEQK